MLLMCRDVPVYQTTEERVLCGPLLYVGMAPLYDFDHALDTTRARDRLLADAVTCCRKRYADEVVRIAEIAGEASNEVFRMRAKSVLEMMGAG